MSASFSTVALALFALVGGLAIVGVALCFRLRKRKQGRVYLGILASCFAALLAWGWYSFIGPGYYAEFNYVKQRLAQHPQLELIAADGSEDLTFENI